MDTLRDKRTLEELWEQAAPRRRGSDAGERGVGAVRAVDGATPARVFVTGHTGFKGAWLAWLVDLGAEVDRLRAGAADRAEPVRAARPAAARSRTYVADVRDRDRAARPPSRPRARGRLPPRRAAAGARRRTPSPRRDLRDERHGHRQRARGGPRAARRCAAVVDRHQRQVLREPRDGRAFARTTPGRPRPVQRQQGLRRARHARPTGAASSRRAARARRLGARRQRDRRRRLGRRPDRARLRAGARRRASRSCVRNPDAVRPWQHVLEPLSGYCGWARGCCATGIARDGAWNFGPGARRGRAGALRSSSLRRGVGRGFVARRPAARGRQPHEADLLLLDSAKARDELGWAPVWDARTAVRSDGRLVPPGRYRRRRPARRCWRDDLRVRSSRLAALSAAVARGRPWAGARRRRRDGRDRAADDCAREILALVGRYYDEAFGGGEAREPRRPRHRPATSSGQLARALRRPRLRRRGAATPGRRRLDFWLTAGRFAEEFERGLADYLGARALPARQLRLVGQPARLHGAHQRAARRAAHKPGDEVITVAAGFPTTVAPIVQNGAVPVFVDVASPTANVDAALLRGGAGAAHPGRHAGAHAGQPLRPRRRASRSASARPVARSRTTATPSARAYRGRLTGTFGAPRHVAASTRRTT